MYPGSVLYVTPQNSQSTSSGYFTYGTPHTPANPASYYPGLEPLLPCEGPASNALPQFTIPSPHPLQNSDTPIRGEKRKRPTDKTQEPRQRLTNTPIRPLKGQALRVRVNYLDDKIENLKEEGSELTREQVLLAGPILESRVYSARTSESEKLQAIFAAISKIGKWTLSEFLYHTFKNQDEKGESVHRTAEHAGNSVLVFTRMDEVHTSNDPSGNFPS